ncbi:unnamed protein product [Caenorhabditis bovis]|uniref:Uncharacterized protein n=1 Tax=Caenorhabditis bovis TaxID=2654633 RepID=A0A8S1EP79_9PELO|nr:unnamed protein product [Caenorhabditis bovis]
MFDPLKLASYDDTLVPAIEGNDLVNFSLIIQSMRPCKRHLRTIVHEAVMIWMNGVIPQNIRCKYTPRRNPQKGNIAIEAHIINTFIELLLHCISIPDTEEKMMRIAVTVITENYIEYLCNRARRLRIEEELSNSRHS